MTEDRQDRPDRVERRNVFARVLEVRPWGRRGLSSEEEQVEVELATLVEATYPEVLVEARARLGGKAAGGRAAAAYVLGLAAAGRPERVPEVAPALAAALPGESHPEVSVALAAALGMLWHPAALDPLLAMAGHGEARVRLEVAIALPGAAGDPPDPRVGSALLRLCGDPDGAVRDWALFSLGHQLDLDTPEIRAALADRLTDVDRGARHEAIVGLARRGDPRAVEPLREALTGREVDLDLIRAAAHSGDPGLLPALRRLRAVWSGDPVLVQEAIDHCDPRWRRWRDDRASWLSSLVEGAFRTLGRAVRVDLGPIGPDDLDPWLWVSWVAADGEQRTWCWDLDILVADRAEGEVELAARIVVADVDNAEADLAGLDDPGAGPG